MLFGFIPTDNETIGLVSFCFGISCIIQFFYISYYISKEKSEIKIVGLALGKLIHILFGILFILLGLYFIGIK